MSKSEFRMQLEEAVQARHSKAHPFSEAWVSGRLNRRILAEWTKQHYHFVSYFPQWLANVFAACDKDDVRHFITENILEEEGFAADTAEFPAIKHTELLLQFAEHCGMPRQEILDAQINGQLLAGTLGLQSWCFRQSYKPFAEAIAGMIVGLESQVPQIYAKTAPPLMEKYGFSEDEIVFFRLHIVADQEHGEMGYGIVEKYSDTPEKKDAAVRIVREAGIMRRLYLDSLYDKYLAAPSAMAA